MFTHKSPSQNIYRGPQNLNIKQISQIYDPLNEILSKPMTQLPKHTHANEIKVDLFLGTKLKSNKQLMSFIP